MTGHPEWHQRAATVCEKGWHHRRSGQWQAAAQGISKRPGGDGGGDWPAGARPCGVGPMSAGQACRGRLRQCACRAALCSTAVARHSSVQESGCGRRGSCGSRDSGGCGCGGTLCIILKVPHLSTRPAQHRNNSHSSSTQGRRTATARTEAAPIFVWAVSLQEPRARHLPVRPEAGLRKAASSPAGASTAAPAGAPLGLRGLSRRTVPACRPKTTLLTAPCRLLGIVLKAPAEREARQAAAKAHSTDKAGCLFCQV